MPLESATYISDLVATNPPSTDQMSQGDDHIRLLKSALKATFPNLNAPVTATPATLNGVAANIAAIVNQRNIDVTALNASVAAETAARAAQDTVLANTISSVYTTLQGMTATEADSLLYQPFLGTARLQAGRGVTDSTGQVVVPFPFAFATQAASIVVSMNSSSFSAAQVHVASWNAAGFAVVSVDPNTGTPSPVIQFSWIAVGF